MITPPQTQVEAREQARWKKICDLSYAAAAKYGNPKFSDFLPPRRLK